MYVLFEIFILIATGIQFAMRDYIFSMKPFLYKWQIINYFYYSCDVVV